jgi:protein-tyrosine phosphatase
MTDPNTRHVWFEACFNFRDLGGYPTRGGRRLRWKTLYRSDTLHRLTAADAEAFAALGLRTVIDLRSATELAESGRLRADAGTVDWHHTPILENLHLRPPPNGPPPQATPAEELPPGEFYAQILEQFGTSVAAAFKLLANDRALPAVFHCTGGRDRTGMVAALVLELVGVDDDVIAEDYLLTQRATDRTLSWVEANEPDFAALVTQIPPEARGLRPDVILGFLKRIRDKHGSAAGFLASVGVTEDEQQSLRRRLVEDVAAG